jgi:hypothetical protein
LGSPVKECRYSMPRDASSRILMRSFHDDTTRDGGDAGAGTGYFMKIDL